MNIIFIVCLVMATIWQLFGLGVLIKFIINEDPNPSLIIGIASIILGLLLGIGSMVIKRTTEMKLSKATLLLYKLLIVLTSIASASLIGAIIFAYK